MKYSKNPGIILTETEHREQTMVKEKWGEYLINSKMKIEIKYNSPLEEKLTSSEEGKEWKGESLGGVAQLENAVSKRKSGKRKVGDRYTKMQKKIMYEWIKGHNEWPYPSQSVKKQLALLAGITTYKISIFFNNYRSREWNLKGRVRAKGGIEKRRHMVDSEIMGENKENNKRVCGERSVSGRPEFNINPLLLTNLLKEGRIEHPHKEDSTTNGNTFHLNHPPIFYPPSAPTLDQALLRPSAFQHFIPQITSPFNANIMPSTNQGNLWDQLGILFVSPIRKSVEKQINAYPWITMHKETKAKQCVFPTVQEEFGLFYINISHQTIDYLTCEHYTENLPSYASYITQNLNWNQEVDLFPLLCNESYRHTTAFELLYLLRRNYLNMGEFKKHLREDIYDSSYNTENKILLRKKSVLIIDSRAKEAKYWLKILIETRRLPDMKLRIQFVRPNFRWELLRNNIVETIENKLYGKDRKQLREFNGSLVKEMANEMKSLIDTANVCLSQFSMELNQAIVSTIHQIALLAIWKTNEEKRWKAFQKPIIEMSKSKQDQLSAFMAEFSGNIQGSCLDDLSRNRLQDELDTEYLFNNKSDSTKGLQYIDPLFFMEFLDNSFENKWNYIEMKLHDLNRKIHDYLLEFWISLSSKIQALVTELTEKECHFTSAMLFVVEGEHKGVYANRFEVQLCQAALQYFYDYIHGTKTNRWKIRTEQDAIINVTFHTDYSLPSPLTGINKEFTLSREHFNGERAPKLDYLCNCFLELIGKEKDELFNKSYNMFENPIIVEKIRDKKEEMRSKAHGCKSTCPTCNRVCDSNHQTYLPGSEQSPHQCSKGHQIRALAGTKLGDKEASVYCCEEMEADDPVEYESQEYTWINFIEKVSQEKDKCWDFKSLLLQRNQKKIDTVKFRMFWKLVGPEFCERQTRNGNTMTMCESSNKEKLTRKCKIHAILALDSSGSMTDHWPSVIKAVKAFLTITKDRGTISIIRFSTSSEIMYENEDINTHIAECISFCSGLTDFSAPMDNAFTILNKYKSTGSSFYYLFMSDGCAPYPTKEIEKIITLNIKNFHYYSIAFGGANDVLNQMSKALKGKTVTCIEPEMLEQAYSKLGYEIIQQIK